MPLQKLFRLFVQEAQRRYNEEIDCSETLSTFRSSNPYELGYTNFIKVHSASLKGTSPTGENLDAIKKYHIPKEFAAVIYMYTAHGVYDEVNTQLRSRNPLDLDIEEYCRLLNGALDMMPSYLGIVYRDIFNPDRDAKEILDEYENSLGLLSVEPAFISSHISIGRWSCEYDGIQIKITTKKCSNGKDLRELTFNADETEVLFKSGTQFKVIAVCKKNNTVEMQEV